MNAWRKLAAELVKLSPAVLVAAGGEPSAVAAKSATAAIPIVFVIGGSPVRGLRGWGRAREADAGCMLLTRVLGRLGVARGEAKPVSIEEFLAQIAAPGSKIPKQDG